MNVNSIKSELIEWLSRLEDKSLLTSILQIKKSAESGDWADHLTPEQIESLQSGLADLENSRVISSTDFGNAYGR